MTTIQEDEKLLLTSEFDNEASPANSKPPPCGWYQLVKVFGYSFLLALLLSKTSQRFPLFINTSISCDDPHIGYTCRPDISRNWGQYSPYFSLHSDISDKTPEGCEITFAQILHRHGARDPTLKRVLRYGPTIIKIQSASRNLTGPYAFIKKYRFDFSADQLNDFGRRQLTYSGAKFYRRYHKLTKSVIPFFRSSAQQRVVESTEAWMKGFHKAKAADYTADKDKYPYDMVTINEGPEFNNTLYHSLCTNLETGPLPNVRRDAKDAWVSVYGRPILYRLQRDLPNVPLTLDDMHNLMSMCPFDTVHSPTGRISPFCDLFTQEEWLQYNHLENLDKFYGYGKGNPLGPSEGVGFVNELIARMTHKPVIDATTTNTTLDSNPSTFPIDTEHKLFADFSHDNDLTAIFFAAGLFDSMPMLSITQVDSINFTQGWSSARTVPFGARAYFEKMQCKSHPDEELVRVIVNDRVMPLEKCGGDELGRCTLSAFVDSLEFARSGGNWDQCFLGLEKLSFKGEVSEVANMSLTSRDFL